MALAVKESPLEVICNRRGGPLPEIADPKEKVMELVFDGGVKDVPYTKFKERSIGSTESDVITFWGLNKTQTMT